MAKQNLVMGLPFLVYLKDKPCSSCEKGKHHRANFKTKQTFSIKKCLHLLHMDLFRPVTPRSINHEKYTLVIVDEYSYQANLKESYLIAVKSIFRYLKGTSCLGLWYPKCSGFDLKGYSDSDYDGCNMDRNSTSAKYKKSKKKRRINEVLCKYEESLVKNKLGKHFKEKTSQPYKLPIPKMKLK
nr:uncharacterized mitochondrial protein AtMg00810-like [Tanacetum cinerariifolium]